MTISPTSGRAGTSVIVSGKGFGRREMVRIDFPNANFVDEPADSDGSFSRRFYVPLDATSGGFKARGLDSHRTAPSVRFEVRAKE